MSAGPQGFIEDYANPDVDPLANQAADFPWGDVYQRLGEAESRLDERDRSELHSALRAILRFIVDGVGKGRDSDRVAGRRVLALVWAVDQSLIDNSPSLTALGKLFQCHKVVMSIHSASARRSFPGIGNRGCSHAWNFNGSNTATTTKPKDTPNAN